MLNSRTSPYVRVLGFSQVGSIILKKIKKKISLPIITRASDYKKLNSYAKSFFEKDLLSSDIYNLAYSNPALRIGSSDFLKKVVYLNPSK